MRFSRKLLIVAGYAAKTVAVVLLVALGLGSAAQRAHRRVSERKSEDSAQAVRARLINSDEGMAIIGAVLEVRYRRHEREDCSHLVHDIYQRAGFPYRYADSSDLYAGVDKFQQVTRAQPGDLAVWKGHAAIVVNPAQHTFFSSTRRGLRVESYDLKYWKRRGTPRFFRYVTVGGSPSVIQTGASSGATLHEAESRSGGHVPDQSDGPK